jgi:thioredoxin reductase (NADPH)
VSHQLVIVGAGPAGVTAALWAKHDGLDFVLLEAGDHAGGQLHRVFSSLVGVPGVTGPGMAFANVLARQLAEAGIAVRRGAVATALVTGTDGLPRVVLAKQDPIAAPAVLVATGLRARTLDLPGERELTGKGVSSSATRDRERIAGQRVVVVGGGDAAFENALLLAGVGCPVTLLVRGRPRAREEFRARVAAEAEIEVVERARVIEILGDSAVTGVRIEDPSGERVIETDAVFVKVGARPNTEWCVDALEHDADGYLAVDPRGATSRPGVWAAGDVTRTSPATVAAAAAGASIAIAAIRAASR